MTAVRRLILRGPVKVKRAVSKGGSVARVRGELRVADGYEEEEIRCLRAAKTLLCLVWAARMLAMQDAGGAVSVEKGVELTRRGLLMAGRCVLSAGTRCSLGGVACVGRALRGLHGGDVDVAGVSGEGRGRVQREAAALRALNGGERARRAWLRVRRICMGREHVGGDADVDALVGLLAEYSELEAGLEQGGVVKRPAVVGC